MGFITEYLKRKSEEHAGRLKAVNLVSKWVKFQSKFPEDIKALANERTVKEESAHLILHNDDITSIEYVMFVLEECFGLDVNTASQLALTASEEGRCVVANDIAINAAEYLIVYLRGHANSRGFPLKWEIKCT